MKKLDFSQEIAPHLIAVVIFLLLVLALFHPVFLENKSLTQYDILQGEGAAKELMDFREATGEEGLWTNSMFSGMPAYLINVHWSNSIVIGIQAFFTLGLPHPVRLIFLAFISYYILLLSFKVRPFLSMAGAICFGFSSFLIVGMVAGHNSRIGAIALLPLVMTGIHLTFSGKRLMGMAVTALALSMQLRINHLQIVYYLLLIVVIYGLIQLIQGVKAKRLKDFTKNIALLTLAVILSIGTFSGALWSILEYSRYSMRGVSELQRTVEKGENPSGLEKDYAFQYSNGQLEALTLLIPNFFGGSSQQKLNKNSHLAKALQRQGLPPRQVAEQLKAVPTYWGDQPLTTPYYVGAIMVFLFVLGIRTVEKKYVIWLSIGVGLGILLAMGKNLEWFNYFMFDYFPGYNKFRSVTFALIISIFCMILLGMMGLEKIIGLGLNKKTQKDLFIAFSITGGFCLLAAIFANIGDYHAPIDERINVPDWYLEAIREDRAALLRSDALRSFFLIAITFGAIYFMLKQKLSPKWALPIITILIIVDSWSVSSRYIGEQNFSRTPSSNYFEETESDRIINQDPTLHFRVLNLNNPFNEARTSYYHSSVGGYHGAKMRRYQDLIENGISQEFNRAIEKLQGGSRDFSDLAILNMLNTKYFKFGDGPNNVVQNTNALGNTWLVSKAIMVNSPDEELDQVSQINPKNQAVVDGSKFELSTTDFDASGTIQLTSYQPNYLKYEVNTVNEALAVFSEVYYPVGWIAKMDGQEVAYIRCNYILRGLQIPPGNHIVEFVFRPNSYFIGNKIMMISSVLLLLVLLGSLGWTLTHLAREENLEEPVIK